MKLIVGLGNPGSAYANTRHNIGFMVLEALARRHELSGAKTKFHAGTIEARIENQRVMLMQPTTFMNRSGLAVGEAARFYKLDPADLMVVVDEVALPTGVLRMRAGGSDGGHNGLADIRRALGCDQYPRLRIGIGEPRIGDRPIPRTDYVLGPFTDSERAEIDKACVRACDALECWLDEGIDRAMTRFNTAPGDPTPPQAKDSRRSVRNGPQPPNEGDSGHD